MDHVLLAHDGAPGSNDKAAYPQSPDLQSTGLINVHIDRLFSCESHAKMLVTTGSTLWCPLQGDVVAEIVGFRSERPGVNTKT
jgi:hypothetical protein